MPQEQQPHRRQRRPTEPNPPQEVPPPEEHLDVQALLRQARITVSGNIVDHMQQQGGQ